MGHPQVLWTTCSSISAPSNVKSHLTYVQSKPTLFWLKTIPPCPATTGLGKLSPPSLSPLYIMTVLKKCSSKPTSQILKLDFFISHQSLLDLHDHLFWERLKNHFCHLLLHHGQTQPAGICHVSLEMPKKVTELGQNKPFVIHQQEMFSGLISHDCPDYVCWRQGMNLLTGCQMEASLQ